MSLAVEKKKLIEVSSNNKPTEFGGLSSFTEHPRFLVLFSFPPTTGNADLAVFEEIRLYWGRTLFLSNLFVKEPVVLFRMLFVSGPFNLGKR